MLIGPTLGRYFAARFARTVLGVFVTVFALVYTLDFVELLRRAGEAEGASTGLMALLSLYRTPAVAEGVLPFAVLFGSMAALLQLSRKLERGVARAAGISAWQFLQPGFCVALALGLGTMVGWKRIVVTVGEKIGKTHLTYAQGASAEIVAAGTIGLAELYGLPVSTTHILSSGVAGTMAANGSGLQMSTVRNMALAWVTTLPAAILIAGTLFFILRHVF